MRALPDAKTFSPHTVLIGLSILAALSVVAFMTIGARGQWDFVLPFRGRKLAAIVLVAYAIGVSTVLFQTITNNRILTPSIMGFDSLYVLIQTVLVFFLGTAWISSVDPRLTFVFEALSMIVFSGLLYRWQFSGAIRGLHLLLLIGVVFGVLFRSIAGFLQRVMDPNEFSILQDRLFASFNSVDANLLGVAALAVAAVSLIGWRMIRTYDVLALGRDTAISLGVDHKKAVATILVMVAVLVSVSTALVGPVTFFGLLVANLAYQIMPTSRHRWVLPAAVLLAVTCLVGGQAILERVLNYNSALSIIIEFIGGLVFIILLLRGVIR